MRQKSTRKDVSSDNHSVFHGVFDYLGEAAMEGAITVVAGAHQRYKDSRLISHRQQR